jgi:hypothetical protein
MYVGLKIRDTIKEKKVKNGYVISAFKDAGIIVSDASFSNKIYGEREQFTKEELEIASKLFNEEFILNDVQTKTT